MNNPLHVHAQVIERILAEGSPASQRKLHDRFTSLPESEREAYVMALIFECTMLRCRLDRMGSQC